MDADHTSGGRLEAAHIGIEGSWLPSRIHPEQMVLPWPIAWDLYEADVASSIALFVPQ